VEKRGKAYHGPARATTGLTEQEKGAGTRSRRVFSDPLVVLGDSTIHTHWLPHLPATAPFYPAAALIQSLPCSRLNWANQGFDRHNMRTTEKKLADQSLERSNIVY
jgi:hypothetical protein